jgi:hypothetical protein
VPSYIAIVVVVILALAALRSLPRLLSSESAKGVLVRNPYVALTVAILTIASLWLHELLYLNVLFLLYCAAMTYVLLATLLLGHRGGNVEDDVRVYLFFFLLQLSALLLLLTPILDEIKVPVAYIVLDVCLWAICGVLLLRLRLRALHLVLLVAVLCLGLATGPVHVNNFARLAPTVDITPLTGATFDRSAYVNGRNVATFDYEDPVYNDAFAAILGARLQYSSRSAEIFRNRWVKVIDATR